MMPGVHPQQLLFAHFWCIDMNQHIEQARFDKSVFYRCEAPRIFQVALARVVLVAVSVADICGAQSGIPLL